MKNPLLKRLPREFRQDFGKYLVIFVFLTATISFVSGFLVADGSMQTAYEEGFPIFPPLPYPYHITNLSAYCMMLIGIILANILLFFGMIMPPLLEHYKIGAGKPDCRVSVCAEASCGY